MNVRHVQDEIDAADDCDRRSDALWATIDEHEEDAFRAKVDEFVAGLPPDSPVVAFERACAFDSTGHPDEAVPLYRRALELGLDGLRRRRAVIQLSSSLRNLGASVRPPPVALAALAPHLPRYQQSVGNYARSLVDDA